MKTSTFFVLAILVAGLAFTQPVLPAHANEVLICPVPATIHTVIQLGTGLKFRVCQTPFNAALGAQVGHNNTSDITQSGRSNSAVTVQLGSGNSSLTEETGNHNSVNTFQAGNNNHAYTSVTGNNNIVNTVQNCNGCWSVTSVAGDGATVTNYGSN